MLDGLIKITFQNNTQLKANDKNIQARIRQIDNLVKDYLPQIFFSVVALIALVHKIDILYVVLVGVTKPLIIFFV